MSDRALSILVHGPAKVGKSTFAVTGPAPILFMDAENASRFLRKADGTRFKRVYWNPMVEAPPEYDGSWEMCVVQVEEWSVATKAYEYLKTNNHPFKSLVVDSITEIQDIAKKKILGTNMDAQMQMKHWGTLLKNMSDFLRNVRDLTKRPDSVLESIVLISISRKIDGQMKPHMDGQVRDIMPYLFDITGYLYTNQITDPVTGELRNERFLWTEQHPQFEAGNRVGYSGAIQAPNVSDMLDDLFD